MSETKDKTVQEKTPEVAEAEQTTGMVDVPKPVDKVKTSNKTVKTVVAEVEEKLEELGEKIESEAKVLEPKVKKVLNEFDEKLLSIFHKKHAP